MRIEALKTERIGDFIEYCRKHRAEVDDSFLYEEDLKEFVPNEENPTYILLDEEDKVVAAASLIINEYNRKGRKARFRIFHSEIEELSCYELLLKALLKHTEGLDKIFVFVNTINTTMLKYVESMNFQLERYSFLLVRDESEVPEYTVPADYEIHPYRPGQDEERWCEVRNPSFATLKGSETPVSPEMVAKMAESDSYLEGGCMILYHKGKAVGVVKGENDELDDAPIMNIGPLAILPEYQGKGLGRILLRASMNYAKEKGYDRTVLCVNGENDRAKALYIQEGFRQVEAVACYDYFL